LLLSIIDILRYLGRVDQYGGEELSRKIDKRIPNSLF
jgi:hypothetical protein